jgi:hypothetical protein
MTRRLPARRGTPEGASVTRVPTRRETRRETPAACSRALRCHVVHCRSLSGHYKPTGTEERDGCVRVGCVSRATGVSLSANWCTRAGHRRSLPRRCLSDTPTVKVTRIIRAGSLPCELRLVARPTVAHTGGYLRPRAPGPTPESESGPLPVAPAGSLSLPVMIRPGLWRISLRSVGLKATRGDLFRFKSDLHNQLEQAIVQPRLYDCLMVTQITLKTELHGFDSCQGHSYGKSCHDGGALDTWSLARWPGRLSRGAGGSIEALRSRTALFSQVRSVAAIVVG